MKNQLKLVENNGGEKKGVLYLFLNLCFENEKLKKFAEIILRRRLKPGSPLINSKKLSFLFPFFLFGLQPVLFLFKSSNDNRER